MSSADDTNSAYSALLDLPVELRCQIYDYLVADSQAITISAGYITIFGNRIQDRARKTDIPGLPLDLAPLVRCHHDTSLLSVVSPPTIAIDNGWMGHVEGGNLGYPAPLALLQTCRQVNDELTDYMRIAQARSSDDNTKAEDTEESKKGLSLYVSYPYGVLVLKTLYPFLLKQARKVHISGYYTTSPKDAEPDSPLSPGASDEERLTPTSSFGDSFGTPTPVRTFNRPSAATSMWTRTASHGVTASRNTPRPRLRLDAPLQCQRRHISKTATLFPPVSPTTATLAPAALALLIRTLLPDVPTQLTKLSARIIYPGENSYGTVWSDVDSPICHILRNICGGKIDMQVKRGSLGTGLLLTARPKPDARIVSTSWENWRGTSTGVGVRRPTTRMSYGDLDAFLIEQE